MQKTIDYKFIGIVFIIFIICLVLLTGISFVGDEPFHAGQVDKFVNGDYSVYPELTVPPTYHFIIASVAKLFGIDILIGYRFISAMILFIFLMFIFYYMVNFDKIKTLQLLFFPTLFIFYFLVYTDLISMFLILASFYFIQRKNYITAGLFSTLSLFIRQNNIFYVGFLMLLIFFECNGMRWFETNCLGMDTKKKLNLEFFWKKISVFLLGIVGFILFVFLKGSVVMGDKESHPIGFHMGNIWLCLFLFFFLFMPYSVRMFPKVIQHMKKNWWIYVGIFCIGLGTFTNTHHYNTYNGIWFNILLAYLIEYWWLEVIFFIIILYSVGVIINTKFIKKEYYWLYPITFIYLGLSWLIEPRYMTMFFAFFLLFKPRETDKNERFTLIYYILCSLGFFAMVIFNE